MFNSLNREKIKFLVLFSLIIFFFTGCAQPQINMIRPDGSRVPDFTKIVNSANGVTIFIQLIRLYEVVEGDEKRVERHFLRIDDKNVIPADTKQLAFVLRINNPRKEKIAIILENEYIFPGRKFPEYQKIGVYHGKLSKIEQVLPLPISRSSTVTSMITFSTDEKCNLFDKNSKCSPITLSGKTKYIIK